MIKKKLGKVTGGNKNMTVRHLKGHSNKFAPHFEKNKILLEGIKHESSIHIYIT